jgi:hypothetical protein
MTVVTLSKSDLQAFEESLKQNPELAELQRLTVQYAEERGGLTLAFWRLHQGQMFGEPVMMTTDECAKRLRVPVSALSAIYEETQRWIDSARGG